jgi:hypothetical protein
MSLQQLCRCHQFVVQVADVTIALWIVVVGIDDDLAGKGHHRHLANVLHWNRDDNDVAPFSRFGRRCRARTGSKLLYKTLQCLRST